jgi:hypothetical protein
MFQASTPSAIINQTRVAEQLDRDQQQDCHFVKSEPESDDESKIESELRGEDDTSSLDVTSGTCGESVPVGEKLGSPRGEGENNLSFLENGDDCSADVTITIDNLETQEVASHEPQPANSGHTDDLQRNGKCVFPANLFILSLIVGLVTENPSAIKEEQDFAIGSQLSPLEGMCPLIRHFPYY